MSHPPTHRSPDNDPQYRRRRAWAKAKAAFGACEVAEVLTRLERCDECPRLLLTAAVHHFLSLSKSCRQKVVRAYLKSLSQPLAELLPLHEMKLVDGQFYEAMRKVFNAEKTHRP